MCVFYLFFSNYLRTQSNIHLCCQLPSNSIQALQYPKNDCDFQEQNARLFMKGLWDGGNVRVSL